MGVWGVDLTPAAAGGMDDSTVLTGPSDTFVEGSDTAVQSHGPTGPNAGSVWVLMTGALLINAAGDYVRDNNGSASNRALMQNDLGSNEHGVEAEFTSTASAGQSVFFGVGCRAASGVVGIEFLYDFANSRWALDDDAGLTNYASEAWPGGTVRMRIVYDNGVCKGYANGVLKVTLTTSAKSGNTRGSLALLNFSGSVDKVHADNYKSMAA